LEADQGVSTIQMSDSSGHFERKIGRKGKGPDEFTGISALFHCGSKSSDSRGGKYGGTVNLAKTQGNEVACRRLIWNEDHNNGSICFSIIHIVV